MHSETDLIIPDKGKLYEETKAKKKKKKRNQSRWLQAGS